MAPTRSNVITSSLTFATHSVMVRPRTVIWRTVMVTGSMKSRLVPWKPSTIFSCNIMDEYYKIEAYSLIGNTHRVSFSSNQNEYKTREGTEDYVGHNRGPPVIETENNHLKSRTDEEKWVLTYQLPSRVCPSFLRIYVKATLRGTYRNNETPRMHPVTISQKWVTLFSGLPVRSGYPRISAYCHTDKNIGTIIATHLIISPDTTVFVEISSSLSDFSLIKQGITQQTILRLLL